MSSLCIKIIVLFVVVISLLFIHDTVVSTSETKGDEKVWEVIGTIHNGLVRFHENGSLI